MVFGYYIFRGMDVMTTHDHPVGEWIKVLPYLVVLGTAIAGMNVALVLILGIATTGVDRPAHRQYQPIRLAWLHGHRNHRNGRTHHHHPDGRRYAGTDPL